MQLGSIHSLTPKDLNIHRKPIEHWNKFWGYEELLTFTQCTREYRGKRLNTMSQGHEAAGRGRSPKLDYISVCTNQILLRAAFWFGNYANVTADNKRVRGGGA